MTRSPQPRRRDTPPPRTGLAEKDVLVGFLDYLRTSVIGKVHDVPEPLVRTPGVPSGTNLLGLLNHLTYVERFTLLGATVTYWPSTFHAGADDSVDALVTAPHSKNKGAPSMRWALAHMIEETGRHAGHLDILREVADGNTGR